MLQRVPKIFKKNLSPEVLLFFFQYIIWIKIMFFFSCFRWHIWLESSLYTCEEYKYFNRRCSTILVSVRLRLHRHHHCKPLSPPPCSWNLVFVYLLILYQLDVWFALVLRLVSKKCVFMFFVFSLFLFCFFVDLIYRIFSSLFGLCETRIGK